MAPRGHQRRHQPHVRAAWFSADRRSPPHRLEWRAARAPAAPRARAAIARRAAFSVGRGSGATDPRRHRTHAGDGTRVTRPFDTVTMAELCARQGDLDEAINIYKRLIVSADDDEVRA